MTSSCRDPISLGPNFSGSKEVRGPNEIGAISVIAPRRHTPPIFRPSDISKNDGVQGLTTLSENENQAE